MYPDFYRSWCWRLLPLLAVLLAPHSQALPANTLSAEASDPKLMGWMQGSPPPEDKRITHPYTNYFTFPRIRWMVCHMRELLPTKQVSRGLAAPQPFERALDAGIDAVSFTPMGSDEPMSWREALSANYTDGMLVLHKGKVVYEYYSGCLDELGKHAAMSMTKSLTGLLAEMLIAEGRLDPQAKVATVVPELKDSAFGNATVRQVMDMTTALSYSENYADPNADVWVYAKAANALPKPADYKGPNGYFEYLQTVKPDGEHGQAFGYRTINSDALGWIIARASGREYTDLLSEKIWQRIGAEQDSYVNVDGIGTAFAGGGLSAGLRDLGRIGQMMLNGGVLNGERIVPKSVVASIRGGASQSAFAKAGYDTLKGASYRSMWWVLHNEHGAFAARGVHGQTIYVDPTAEMVIVRFASYPLASNAHVDPTSLPAFQAVAEYLMVRPDAN
ncbi:MULTISPECIES: serine hydrolase domain-containing protein [Spongiibacter]|uniref:serine hydrolase domain-containing protein n=1 Tax=Spongiibacter TaxID=630749 RepID=UPI0023565344|nr:MULTISPECIES: serine hydrolase [Spongiibacter]|tara:strand:+ start:499 stop:1836 length:1338 start_codon:yes stop_codon:yes gene_type:complete